jgi:hypothetical protein
LGGWVARLIVDPENVSEALDADRTPLRDTEHPQRKSGFAAAELMLGEPFDGEPADDVDSHLVRQRRRAHRRRCLSADHGT